MNNHNPKKMNAPALNSAKVLGLSKMAPSTTEAQSKSPSVPEPTGEDSDNTLQAQPKVLTVLEVAELLRCNRKTVYEAIRRRGLPYQKISARALRFSREAVLEWLRSGQVSHKGRTSNGRT
jgi:excisionase family DNA binding protein